MSPNQLPEVPTTKVLAIGRPTAAGSTEAIAQLRRSEIQATVNLHLAGIIEQWWFQIDGRAPVFVLNVTDTTTALGILDQLPLGKAGLMEFDLVRLGPLRPLAVLID